MPSALETRCVKIPSFVEGSTARARITMVVETILQIPLTTGYEEVQLYLTAEGSSVVRCFLTPLTKSHNFNSPEAFSNPNYCFLSSRAAHTCVPYLCPIRAFTTEGCCHPPSRVPKRRRVRRVCRPEGGHRSSVGGHRDSVKSLRNPRKISAALLRFEV